VPLIGSIQLSWDASVGPDVAGYNLYAGQTADLSAATPINVGNVTTTSYIVTLVGVWYFEVKTYNSTAVLSGFSNEISDTFTTLSPTGPKPPSQGPFIVKLGRY
jgi:hypothetical protein